jgi:hypothetical protein
MTIDRRFRQDLRPLTVLVDAGKLKARATCIVCGFQDDIPAPGKSAGQIRSLLASRGWGLGHAAWCEQCDPKSERNKKLMTTLKPAAKPVAPSPAALALNRDIRNALDLAYDDDKQRYNAGYSDEKVAQIVGGGCPPAAVAALREKAYGPVGEPDEVSEIRSAIDLLTSEIGKLRSRFDLMCTKNGFK